MFKQQTKVQKPSGQEPISVYMAGDTLKLQPSVPLWNHLSPPLASYCFSLQHISCLHLDWSGFYQHLQVDLHLSLTPELYASKPYSAFEIVPGPLYSSELSAMAQLLIGKPIEKLPVEGQGCMFLQALSPLPCCSPAPIWSQVADVFYLACFCTFSTLWFTAAHLASLEQIKSRFLVWIEDI